MTTMHVGAWARRAGFAAGVMMLYRFATLFVDASRGYRLAGRSRAFERDHAHCRARVLVVGDSLGVGTGASCAEDSIAGLLAKEFPHVAVVNRARNGAKAADALAQLVALGPERYDAVLLHVGGNDILRATPLPELEAHVAAVLHAAREVSDTVVFMSAPNVGLCPVFFPPFSWLLTMRTRQARDIFLRLSAAEGVTYIDLFHERREDVFSRDPARYFARDRLHPSSESYRAAYHAIRDGSRLHEALAPIAAVAAALDVCPALDDLPNEADPMGNTAS